jgi:Zn finger protein HypA/HybF involved in hydrogenase expression
LTEEEQVIVCEGCGSKWRVSIAKGRAVIIARLKECPLCENKEAES